MSIDSVIGGEALAERLRALSRQGSAPLTEALERLTQRLLNKVQQEKLGGQVLQSRTGALRRSIEAKVVSENGTIRATVGTKLRYGLAHEFGSHGTVSVKAHLRQIRVVFGRQIKSPVWAVIPAHSMRMNLPERSFLRSALAEMAPEIQAEIDAATKEGIRL